MKFKDNLFILLVIFALFGFLVTLQVRSTVSMQKQSAETLDLGRLKSQLDDKISQGEQYKAEINKLENDKEAFLKSSSANVANEGLKVQLDYLQFISGLGDGIVITLNDAETPDTDSLMDYIIHDLDVYSVINKLRIAGAQAISINDEKIMATSEQLCAGPTIKINNNRYAVPYEIKAIGDADALYAAMKESSIVSELTEYKRVTLKKQEYLVMPKFRNGINSLISRQEVINNESKKNK